MFYLLFKNFYYFKVKTFLYIIYIIKYKNKSFYSRTGKVLRGLSY